jgi:ABC-type multidrug transport system permease subunit
MIKVNKDIADAFEKAYAFITVAGFCIIFAVTLIGMFISGGMLLMGLLSALLWFLSCGFGSVLLAMYRNSNRQTELLEMAIQPNNTPQAPAGSAERKEPTFNSIRV